METAKIDIPFFKYVSSGNDFIVIEGKKVTPRVVQKMCLEKWGIHSDGVLLLNQENHQWRLTIFNADGSKAKMCGNGLKVVAAYLKMKEPHLNKWEIFIGKRKYQVKKEKQGVSVRIPFPKLIKKEEETYLYHVGNLHRLIEHNKDDEFQTQIAKEHPNENVSFYQVKKEGKLEVRTYERGVGFTYSCGSASLAVAFHYLTSHPHLKSVQIVTRGGSYQIKKQAHFLLLKGKVKFVFIGRYKDEIS